MRVKRPLFPTHKPYAAGPTRAAQHRSSAMAITALLICSLLPQTGASADRMPTGSGLASRSPVVNGTDFMIAASDFKSDRTEVKESSFKKDLTLSPGSLNATFISDPTRAPQDFTDLGPRWSADEPPNTTVSLELRTGPDSKSW